jgi:arylsulfatase A-like enzyme
MLRLLFILLLVFAAESAKSPNVLFISVDDWNDWVGCYGGNQAKTPNLDKLAARGTIFRNAHTSAVYCAPSRTSLMTGLNPFTTGCYHDQPHFSPAHDPDIKDLPIWFREQGYHVAGGGKLYHHMPGFIDMRGWHEYFHWNEAKKLEGWGLDSWTSPSPLPAESPASPIAKRLFEQELKKAGKSPKRLNFHMEWGIIPDEKEDEMADTICTAWAADFIRDYDRDEPFLLGYGLYAPHKPNFAPQRYFKMNPLSEVVAPEMHPGDLDDLPPILRKRAYSRKAHIHDQMHELKCAKKAVRAYLAALSYADAMVGRVLDALAASPHADNTVVVLWSDNGYHLGEKGAWAKHTLWERTSKVPLIWAGPGVAKGGVIDSTVSLLDVYPTLLSVCGLPANSANEGVSLASMLANPASAKDRTVIQNDAESFALINQRWRYVRSTGNEEQLYDLKADPGEHQNLAQNPEYKAKLAEFAAELPEEIAKPGLRPKDRELVLSKKGETFAWKHKKK